MSPSSRSTSAWSSAIEADPRTALTARVGGAGEAEFANAIAPLQRHGAAVGWHADEHNKWS